MPGNTAVIIIDPYNDFLHPKGKLTGLLADSLKETDTITHLKEMVGAARANKIPIYYGLHQQAKPGFLAGWKHATPVQKSQKENIAFEEGSWGVDICEGLEPSLENRDVIVSKHWSSRYVSGVAVEEFEANPVQLVPEYRSRLPVETTRYSESGHGWLDLEHLPGILCSLRL